MLLSDVDILHELGVGSLAIDPFDAQSIQPASVDLRISDLFRVFHNSKYTHIDPSQEQPELTSLYKINSNEPFILHPREFVLASTLECVTLDGDLAGRLEGKSSLGRLGLCVHSTAGFIDPGFSGTITIELSNVVTLPISVWPGMKIGQLALFKLSSPARNSYGSNTLRSKYQHQQGPTPSKAYLNFDRNTTLQEVP